MAENEKTEKIEAAIPVDTRTSGSSHSVRDEKPPDEDVIVNVGEAEKKEEDAGFGNYLKIWSYASPLDRLFHAFGFFAAIGAGAAMPLMTLVFGELVNVFNDPNLSPEKMRSEINKNTLWFVYLFIGKFLLVYMHTTCFTIAATRMTTRIRIEYIKSILKQEVAYFDICTPGTVSSKVSTNANLIQTGISEKVGVAVQGLAMLGAAFAVAFSQQWKLTLVTATTLPGVVILIGITVGIDQKYETRILETYSKAGSLAEEVLSSMRNVIAFGAHETLKKKYEDHLEVIKKYGAKKGPIYGVQYSVEFSVMYCGYALSFWYGIKLYIEGEIMDPGTIITVFFSCIMATSSLTIIAPNIGVFTQAAAAAKDVFAMIARKSAIDATSPEGLKPETPVVGRIELKNISFTYPARPTVKVLDNVSLVFEERKTTALVGASGSGKSTIVGLTERWYDPGDGIVSLDGNVVQDLNLKWLRSQIGLVSQEPVLFNDTIANNVAYGLSDAQKAGISDEERLRLVKEACMEANAHDFIENLPEGYDTNVGEKAGLISGGQKQRIALARSIIKNPAILLLDEATSALDPKSEAVVQAALDKAAESRTTILIAHRLSTVKSANKIVVLSKGKVIEQGSHHDLLERKGAYWRLVTAQTLAADGIKQADTSDSTSDGSQETEDSHALDRTETQRSAWSAKSEYKLKETKKRGLIMCIYTVFMEHTNRWPWFLAGTISCIAGGVVFPAQAILFSRIVTVFQYTGEKLKDERDFWALMFFILAIGTFLAWGGLGFCWTRLAFIMSPIYRAQYFSILTGQDVAFYDLPENASGALTSRLSSDPQNVHDMINGSFGVILLIIVNLTSSIILALCLHWKLALVAIFGALPVLFAAGMTRMKLEFSAQERTTKFFLESARFATEAVGSIRTVSSLTLEDEVLTRYTEKLYGPIKRAYMRVLGVMMLFGLSESVDMLGMALTFWYGGRLLSFGEITARTFFVVFIAIVFGGQAAGMLFGFTANITKFHTSANHIIHLGAQTPPINSSTGPAPPPPSHSTPTIEFKNVSFSYPTRPSIPVLRKFSLSIPRAHSVALVGASGCGKSTIISLLERFYDPTSGEILINGSPLTSLSPHLYRSKVALVAQEPVLYQGTITSNILLGLPSPPKNPQPLVENAAKEANIHDFILSLPQGYETDVGSKGVALSGGQRQRLAIARALIRDPEILLLDEATSALDTESERVVQAAVDRASVGRTVIVVAHRLSTVRRCERICVLEGGRVVESGTHEELRAKGGVYEGMCRGQGLEGGV